MLEVRAFHSRNEVDKPADDRRYHDRSDCAGGKDIPEAERLDGTGAYLCCEDCAKAAIGAPS
jgi:hypothetical protein